MKLSGKSSKRIAQEFNQSQNFPWIPSSPKHKGTYGWWPSYIKKIFQFRAVIGEYQPHRLIDGKRVPVGEPIANYYPVAFDGAENLFYQVQQKTKSAQTPRKDGSGVTGLAGKPKVRKIFSGTLSSVGTATPRCI